MGLSDAKNKIKLGLRTKMIAFKRFLWWIKGILLAVGGKNSIKLGEGASESFERGDGVTLTIQAPERLDQFDTFEDVDLNPPVRMAEPQKARTIIPKKKIPFSVDYKMLGLAILICLIFPSGASGASWNVPKVGVLSLQDRVRTLCKVSGTDPTFAAVTGIPECGTEYFATTILSDSNQYPVTITKSYDTLASYVAINKTTTVFESFGSFSVQNVNLVAQVGSNPVATFAVDGSPSSPAEAVDMSVMVKLNLQEGEIVNILSFGGTMVSLMRAAGVTFASLADGYAEYIPANQAFTHHGGNHAEINVPTLDWFKITVNLVRGTTYQSSGQYEVGTTMSISGIGQISSSVVINSIIPQNPGQGCYLYMNHANAIGGSATIDPVFVDDIIVDKTNANVKTRVFTDTFTDPQVASGSMPRHVSIVPLGTAYVSTGTLKCKSDRKSLVECMNSCALGVNATATCSGSTEYCANTKIAWDEKVRSGSNNPTPAKCLPVEVADCFCADVKETTVKHATEKLDSTGVRAVTVGRIYKDTLAPLRSRKTLVQRKSEMHPEFFGSVGSFGRRLLEFGSKQFSVVFDDEKVVVTQDMTQACSVCTEKTVYFMQLSLKGTEQEFVIQGKYTIKTMSSDITDLSGDMKVTIVDESMTTVYMDFVRRVGFSDVRLPDCYFCYEFFRALPQMPMTQRVLYIAIMMIIALVILILLARMLQCCFYGFVFLNGMCGYCLWCSCCTRALERSKAISQNVWISTKDATQKAYTAGYSKVAVSDEEKMSPMEMEDASPVIISEPPRRKPQKISRSPYMIGFIMMLSLLCFAQANSNDLGTCSNGLFIPVSYSTCAGGNCTLEFDVTVSIPSGGSSACMNIGDKNSQDPIARMTLFLNKTDMEYEYDYQYSTNPWSMIYDSHNYCGGHSTCSSVGSNVGPNDDPDGIFSSDDGRLMTNPGVTSYHDSCGCAGCGCFMCSHSCTYTRWSFLLDDTIQYSIYKRSNNQILKPLMSIFYTDTADGVPTEVSDPDGILLQTGVITSVVGFDVEVQGFLNSDNFQQIAPDYIISAYKPSDKSTVYYGAPSAIVSATNVPTKGLIGDVQYPATGHADLSKISFDSGAVTCSSSKYDSCYAVASGVSNFMSNPNINTFPYNNMVVYGTGTNTISAYSESSTIDSAPLISVRTTKDIVFEQQVNVVCPKVQTTSNPQWGGYAGSGGCMIPVRLSSTCQTGSVIVTVEDKNIYLYSSIITVPEDYSDKTPNIWLTGYCNTEIVLAGSIKFCYRDNCVSIDYDASTLIVANFVQNGTDIYSGGTATANGSKGSGGFNIVDFFDSLADPVIDFLASLIGMHGLLGAIISVLIYAFIFFLIIMGMKMLWRRMLKPSEPKAARSPTPEDAEMTPLVKQNTTMTKRR